MPDKNVLNAGLWFKPPRTAPLLVEYAIVARHDQGLKLREESAIPSAVSGLLRAFGLLPLAKSLGRQPH